MTLKPCVLWPLLVSLCLCHRFCDYLTSGQFGRLDLRSVTYLGQQKVVLVVGGGDIYELPLESLTEQSAAIREYPNAWSEEDSLAGIQIKLPDIFRSHLRSLTVVSKPTKSWTFASRTLASVVTDTTVYLIDMTAALLGKRFQTVEYRNFYPNFSVLMDQPLFSDRLTTYAIHKDFYDQTNHLIIYRVHLDTDPLRLSLHTPNSTELDRRRAAFFYLELGQDPSQMAVVSRTQMNRKSSSDRIQLLHRLPVGFVHRGQLFLMEPGIGCVYVIPDFRLPLSPTVVQHLRRYNTPFEHFFQCPEGLTTSFPRKQYAASRCDFPGAYYDRFPAQALHAVETGQLSFGGIIDHHPHPHQNTFNENPNLKRWFWFCLTALVVMVVCGAPFLWWLVPIVRRRWLIPLDRATTVTSSIPAVPRKLLVSLNQSRNQNSNQNTAKKTPMSMLPSLTPTSPTSSSKVVKIDHTNPKAAS